MQAVSVAEEGPKVHILVVFLNMGLVHAPRYQRRTNRLLLLGFFYLVQVHLLKREDLNVVPQQNHEPRRGSVLFDIQSRVDIQALIERPLGLLDRFFEIELNLRQEH